MRPDEYDDDPYVVIEKHGSSVGPFLWGLAVGAGIALLFAPQSGDETRADIRRRARRVKTAARDVAGELSDTVADRYQNARQQVEEKIDSARAVLDLKKRQASEAIRAGREAAQQARDELEARISESKAAYTAGAKVVRAGRRPAKGAAGAISVDNQDDDDVEPGV